MDKKILAAASFYKKSYYFNFDDFADLPHAVQKELQKIITKAAQDTQGEVLLGIYPNGQVSVESRGADEDWDYDQIGAKYYVNRLVADEEIFFESIQLWFTVKRLGGDIVASGD